MRNLPARPRRLAARAWGRSCAPPGRASPTTGGRPPPSAPARGRIAVVDPAAASPRRHRPALRVPRARAAAGAPGASGGGPRGAGRGGDDPLTRWPAARTCRRGSPVSSRSVAPGREHAAAARDVTVVSGSQSALSSIFRAVVGPGRPLLIESPTYWGAILAAEQAGVVLVPIPTGVDGPDPDEVARAFDHDRRPGVLRAAGLREPDRWAWPRRDGHGRCWKRFAPTGRSSSRTTGPTTSGSTPSPGRSRGSTRTDTSSTCARSPRASRPPLRVAAVMARGPARERILADRAAESMYVSGLLQAAALDVVTQPGLAHAPARAAGPAAVAARPAPRQPARARARPSPSRLPVGRPQPLGPAPGRERRRPRSCSDCAGRGLVIAPGAEWFPAEPAGPYVRLNYSGDNPERFPDAARILGEVLAQTSR